jgi:fatty acid desaturase
MYRSPLSRELLRELTRPSNRSSLIRLTLHLALLLLSGALFLWATEKHPWLCLPILMLHGMIFTFLGYAGLGHELHHDNVFSRPAVNHLLLLLVSFLTWNNPVYFKASHRYHHKYTLHKAVDFEVDPRPYPLLEQWWRYAFIDFVAMKRAFLIFYQNARGLVKGPFAEIAFPTDSQARQNLIRTAQIHLVLHLLLAILFTITGHWELLLLISLANFFCTLPNRILAKLQHCGLQNNSSDFRHNTRTVLLPKFWAFLYWNMNYHTEHHMYPSVPYCQLPALRNAIKPDLPVCKPGLLHHLPALRMPKKPLEKSLSKYTP